MEDASYEEVAYEAKVPLISDSKACTASFACIEELGVTPPPPTGWVPREEAREEKEGERPSGGRSQDAAEWWKNTLTSEWVYHATEDMYFHLPTSSLWEQRHVECADGEDAVDQVTYYRTDAMHLQALSMFASALDSALVPMTWKCWIRYMRGKKGRHFGMGPPPASPEKVASRTNSQPKKGHGGESAGKEAARNQSSPAGAANASRQTTIDSDAQIREADEPTSPAMPVPRPTKMEEAALAAAAAAVAAVADAPPPKPPPPPPEPLPPPVKEKAPPQAASGFNHETSDGDGRRKGGSGSLLVCLRCFRGGGQQGSPKAVLDTKLSTDRKAGSAVSASATPSHTRADTGRGGPSGEMATANPTEERKSIEIVDKHVLKLEKFLELVHRNPQRLVDHVERRRAGKTALAFVIV